MVKIVKENNEMDDVVQSYCEVIAESTDRMCAACRIEHLCEPIDGDFESNPTNLKEAYEIVTNNEGLECCHCLYADCSVDDYPCTKCRNNKLKGESDYETTPCMWTPQDVEVRKEKEEVTNEVTNEVLVTNAVDHPSHYNQSGMECIDEMVLIFGVEAVKHFCLLNAWKYRARAMYKNGQEDMDKANWYIATYKELTDSA